MLAPLSVPGPLERLSETGVLNVEITFPKPSSPAMATVNGLPAVTDCDGWLTSTDCVAGTAVTVIGLVAGQAGAGSLDLVAGAGSVRRQPGERCHATRGLGRKCARPRAPSALDGGVA